MHNVLRIDEVVQHICRYVGQPEPIADAYRKVNRKESRYRDLAAMARTCRSFSTQATESLWSKLDSLVPLLHCLPDDLVLEKRVPPQYVLGLSGRLEKAMGPTCYFELRRSFSPNDWDIWSHYARRIVELSMSYDSDIHIDSRIYDALVHSPLQYILPRLRTLYYPESEFMSSNTSLALTYFT
ncbi:hypothetical protein CONPUDRAFT_140804 [Coniophora puteana RWD-64-598 SS2]|uniref:F-box domain-containing protein n=1 Tax=Coniophora puteana (strain RWD-64-598) TaxID=741705 RepID=A0A5M3N591_CONPW|nr:uncharacterized protein CONPUDRAFT_140804 [Coniophora puteana RWD-64-598 SS2]EIW86081.1 hypothetical protein CONPUDRAFT_140804 [Coniophora puteana RWD-64-598 SS2]